jgi:hypothetical protein
MIPTSSPKPRNVHVRARIRPMRVGSSAITVAALLTGVAVIAPSMADAPPASQPSIEPRAIVQTGMDALLQSPATQPLTQPAAGNNDAIDRLVKQLNADPFWTNGIFQPLQLDADSDAEKIVAAAASRRSSGIQTCGVLETRTVDLDSGDGRPTAALLQTDAGTKILIFYRLKRPSGWWTRFYDVAPSAATQASTTDQDALRKFVEKLQVNRAWTNGSFEALLFAKEDATVGDVIEEAMHLQNSPFNQITTHRVLGIQRVEKLAPSGQVPWLAVLLETNLGTKALLLRYAGRSANWAARLYDLNGTEPLGGRK